MKGILAMKKDTEKKVSVIVPIYNVEVFIEKCVKSIMNQTYKNIELIFINDGSTDKTEEIANALAACLIMPFVRRRFETRKNPHINTR